MTVVGGVLALSEAATVAVVAAVLSAVVGPVWVARIAASARATAEQTQERIGSPNGHGDLVTMMERLLAGQVGQDNRLGRIEHRLSRGDERMGGLGARVSTLSDEVGDLSQRVQRIETSCTYIAAHVHEDDDE